MALATSQLQNIHKAYPFKTSVGSGQSYLRESTKILHVHGRRDKFTFIQRKYCLRGKLYVLGPKRKPLTISAFKGNGREEDSNRRSRGSKSSKNSVQLSYVPQDSEEAPTESHDINAAYPSDAADGMKAGSQAIQKLFKNWLTRLHSPPIDQSSNDILEEQSSTESSKDVVKNEGRGEILMAVCCYFLRLDATIKIPLMMLIPGYLAVNIVYGAEVARDLNGLWIFGPLFVALCVKIIQVVFALCLTGLTKMVEMVKKFPDNCMASYTYFASGMYKEDIQARVMQPVVGLKNLDYKAVVRKKVKEWETYWEEKSLDLVEFIWPFYFRFRRFLKRANLL